MRTLYIIKKGMNKPSDDVVQKMESEGIQPRVSTLEKAISSDVLDERYLKNCKGKLRKWIYRRLPVEICQILETLKIHQHYDVIYVHTEQVALPLAIFIRLFRVKTHYVITISRITSKNQFKTWIKQTILRWTHSRIDSIVMWSSAQRRIVTDRIGVSPKKIALIKLGTDHRFWKPMDVQTDMICSVGMEMRDYPTLVEALRPLNIPCHFATGSKTVEIFDTVEQLHSIKDIPKHITIGKKSPIELRELYSRSRFVVLSLLPTDSDNGLTVILEAMAMAKPVICTSVDGQVDVIKDGITGIFVPQGDPEAIRKAILDLWENPEKAESMGRAARSYIEQHHSMDQYVTTIQQHLLKVVNSNVAVDNHG